MKIPKPIFFLFVLTLLSLNSFAQTVIEARDRYAKFGDIKVHYFDQGKDKEALIFIHGWTCSMEFWKPQFTGFAGKRVIFIDLPGHGKSDRPKTNYTMEYFARSIEAVMRDAKVKKAVLAGHSMGAPVIHNFYKLYPDKTLGMVVVDGALRPYDNTEESAKYMAMFRADYQKTASTMIDTMMPTASPALQQQIKTSMLATPEHVALSAMENMMRPESFPKDKINVPVIAILADSPVWAADNEKFMRSLAPDLDYVLMKGVSHFLMMEKPQEFNRQVAAFLERKKLL